MSKFPYLEHYPHVFAPLKTNSFIPVFAVIIIRQMWKYSRS